jgi:nucleotide-binding universal stress UspA family protein
MFTRILVAVDSDEIADTVVAAAGRLAGPLNAQVALLHVVDTASAIAPLAAAEPTGLGVPPLASAANMGMTEQLIEDQERSAETLVQKLAQRLPEGIAADALMREGTPAETIITTAQEWKAGLIVMGTHGRGGLERLVVGSTAEAVLRAATCPVLTIRAGVQPS